MRYFFTQHELEQYEYKRKLKKDMNIAGGFLLATQLVINVIVEILGVFLKNTEFTDINKTTLLMILNSIISISAFFITGIIYCGVSKIKISEIVYFEKNKSSVIIPLCILGLSIAMIANYFSSVIIGLFDMFGIDASSDINYEFNNAFDIIIFYISIAIVPAFVEEFAFRGVVLGILRKYSDSLAILVSSIMFGLMHGNFMQIPFAFIVGLILGYITVKSNSMLPAMIIHFLNNAISVTISLLSECGLSTGILNFMYSIFMIIIAIGGIVSFKKLSNTYKGLFMLSSKDEKLPYKEKVKIFVTSPTIIIFSILIIFEAIMSLKIG